MRDGEAVSTAAIVWFPDVRSVTLNVWTPASAAVKV